MTVISRTNGRNRQSFRAARTARPYLALLNGALIIALIFVAGANISFANASVSKTYQVGGLNETFNVVSSDQEAVTQGFDVTMDELVQFAEDRGMVQQVTTVTLSPTVTPAGLALSQ